GQKWRRGNVSGVAERAGGEIVDPYEAAALPGKMGRDKPPAFERLLRDAIRRKFDIVAVWAVDRLGRSLKDLVNTLHELQATNVDLFVNKQAIDTTTPTGKAFYGMLGVFAEFERDMIVERVKSGLDRAKKNGANLGRPRCDASAIRAELARGTSRRKTAAKLGVALSTVQKAKAEAVAA